ncbi:hypothetical protein TWF706_001316, partial [Orbilia oligospora]
SLDDEYLGELQTFHDLGASGWVNYQNPTTCTQATKVSCLICGYTYVEEISRVDLAHTLDHFTRIALVESEACISCNLIDLYKINKRAQRLLKASAKGETDATSETSKKISADIIEIDRRLLAIEQGLRRKLTNDRIPVDDNGRLRGINMRSEAMTPRSPRSETQAISRLPNTIILGYNIVHSDTMKKNRTQLKIPQVLSFASWTADITDGNHSRDPLRPLRPKGSKYNDGIEFECRAISYHHGETTNSGHYFTDRLPWIPNPRDVAAGAAPREPYEWWFCNEYITDMFAADQPFPRPSGAKEQEVLVVYERIMDPADKAAIILPSADTTRLFDFNREYQFSEYSIPAGGPVVFKNEQNMEGKSSPRLDLSKWTKITGFFGGVGTRSSKRVRVHDYENEDISISSAVEIMETRPPKRARVAKHEVGAGWGLRSTRGAGHEPNVERERRKAMENLHDSSLIRHPEVLADFEQKKKWRMGGSHGGDFIIPPSPDASNSSIDSGSNDRNRQRKNSPGKRNRIQKVPSSNSITPIYVVHEDEPEGCYRMEYVEKASSSNHPISERAKAMGYRQEESPEAASGLTGCTKQCDILNKVFGRNSRVIKRQTFGIGLRMAKGKKDGDEDSDDDEDDEEEEEEEEEEGGDGKDKKKPDQKPAPSRPNADPWATGGERQTITGIERADVGNLCYVNTALQGLAATSYPEWVNITTKAAYADDPKKGDLAKLIDGVFKQLNHFTKKKYESRATILTPTTDDLTFPDLGTQQHCATELIVRLNDRIIENMNTIGYENRIKVGVLTRRNCLDCGNVWTQAEEYPSLQLYKPLKTLQATLNETLEWHQRIEYWLTGRCNRCRGLAIRKILRRALRNSTRDRTSAANVKIIRNRIQLLEQSLRNHTYNNLTNTQEIRLGLARIAPYPVRPTKTADMTDTLFKGLKDTYDKEIIRRTINYESDWSQTQAITDLPEILIVEFVNVPGYDARGRPTKLKSRVTFDPYMDFTNYVAGPNRNIHMGNFNLPIRMLGDAANPAVPTYELRAILVHQGTDFVAGHWYCYRREWKDPVNPVGEQWWLCDEANTLRVGKQDLFGGNREDPRTPRPGQLYALIYEVVPPGGTVPGKGGDESNITQWKEAK